MKTTTINSVLLLALLFIVVGCNEVGKSTEENATLKNTAEEILKDDAVNVSIQKNAIEFLKDERNHSVSIGVYKDGEKYPGHFGELTIDKGDLPTDNIRYDIASVTKTMVGIVLANAVLETG